MRGAEGRGMAERRRAPVPVVVGEARPEGRSGAWWEALDPGPDLDDAVELAVVAATHAVAAQGDQVPWDKRTVRAPGTVALSTTHLRLLQVEEVEVAGRWRRRRSVRRTGLRIPVTALQAVEAPRATAAGAAVRLVYGVSASDCELVLEVPEPIEVLDRIVVGWVRSAEVIHPPEPTARGVRFPLSVPVELAHERAATGSPPA